MVSSIGIDGGILVTARAEGFRVDVATTVPPKVPAAAFNAEMNGASVAEHDGHIFLADLTALRAVGDDHKEDFSSSVNFSALMYPMNVEKASILPGDAPEAREKHRTV